MILSVPLYKITLRSMEKEQTSEKASGIFIISMILLVTLFYLLLGLLSSASAQPAEYKMAREEYIEKYKDDAIKEMLMHGVPASITLAQGMLESGNGNSALAAYANNHFGVKCHNDWTGPTYIYDDDEKDECFRKYPTVLDSYSDHSLFLQSRPRYAFLFNLHSADYKAWAMGLKEAGYATDPRYSEKLIEIIEQNKLYLFDSVGSLPNIAAAKPKHTKATVKASQSRNITFNNKRKCIIIKSGDSFNAIARDFNIELWDLYKYNDINNEYSLRSGEKVYLEPKRKRAEEEHHIVKPGETMQMISQEYGIKLKSLYRKNHLKRGTEPIVGVELALRNRK